MSWVLYSPDPEHLRMLSYRCILEYENKTCKAMVGDKGARPRFPPWNFAAHTEHHHDIINRTTMAHHRLDTGYDPTRCSLAFRGLACGLKLRLTQATSNTWPAITYLQTRTARFHFTDLGPPNLPSRCSFSERVVSISMFRI